MKFLNSKAGMVAAAAVVGVVAVLFLSRRAAAAVGDTASAVGNAVNPTNNDNIFARGVNAIGDSLDDAEDNNSFSLGGSIFDLVQRFRGIPEFDPNAPTSDHDSIAPPSSKPMPRQFDRVGELP